MSYTPIIKKRGFDPYPGRVIPLYADSVSNPDCKGTDPWREWWEQQFDYCTNGYTTGGIFLPPPYYYYLNFQIIDGLLGAIHPDYVDMQYELARTIQDAQDDDECTGVLIPKKRRAGISFYGQTIASHGMRFVDDYRMGVVSGLDTWVKGFQNKLYKFYNEVPPELQMNHHRRNDQEFKLGYTEVGENRRLIEINNALLNFATLQDQAEKLEGEYFHHVIMEETGHFPKAVKAYNAMKPNLMLGTMQIGIFLIYGTGGNMMKGSKAFKTFYDHLDSYSLKYYFIPAGRYLYPYYRGAKGKHGEIAEKTPNLDKDYKGLRSEQLMGCEDFKAADDMVVEETAKRAKNPDKKALVEWKQKYPRDIQEVFNSSGSNHFNNDKLYQNLFDIDSYSETPYQEFILDFVKDEDGNIQIPMKVKARPVKASDKPYLIHKIFKHPIGYKNADVNGVDSYNEDNTLVTTSQGASIILRNYDGVHNDDGLHGKVPVALYYCRPPRKETFWIEVLKLSIYFNTLKNTNISAESDMTIQYFKEMNAKKYLSPRPKSFDAEGSKLLHDYGTKMTVYSKPRMVSLIQSWVEDYIHLNVFRELTNDLIAYDEENIGTDWDSADALGLALIRFVDMNKKPAIEEEGTAERDFMGLHDPGPPKTDPDLYGFDKKDSKTANEMLAEFHKHLG